MPIAGAAADRDLAPAYPGITESDTLARLGSAVSDRSAAASGRSTRSTGRRIGRRRRRSFPLEVGQALWQSRYGALTSVRLSLPGQMPLRGAAIDSRRGSRRRSIPSRSASSSRDVRREGLAASRGATDFGEYFTYFSFFLVVSALLLARCSSSSASSSARARSACCGRSASPTRRCAGCSSAEGAACSRSSAACIGIAGAVAYGDADDGRAAHLVVARSGRRR